MIAARLSSAFRCCSIDVRKTVEGHRSCSAPRPMPTPPTRKKRARRSLHPSKAAPPSQPDAHSEPAEPALSVVAIGASAGGLDAFERFLKHVPDGCGMAFVYVQHLDPAHKGMLAELLQRSTKMPVDEAIDSEVVEAEHVYVIPPGMNIALQRGRLRLTPQPARHGPVLPIDFFFRSVAEELRERSVGVILSGMGSDGTIGLRAIKEVGGAAFVQSPTTAQFDGMPRSAIAAGLADVEAAAEALPAQILAVTGQPPHAALPEPLVGTASHGSLEELFAILLSRTGNDFSLYKKSTLTRRIERRMRIHQMDVLAHYVDYVRENPVEAEVLFKELLIGVTNFFRDAPVWEHLRTDELPGLFASRPSGTTLRAWVVGCSTGEEAYSLAMVFREAAESFRTAKGLKLQIFATDLDRDAIEKARVGRYPSAIDADVSAGRLQRFFAREERGYRVVKDIREMVVFAPQNVLIDPPFLKLDIVSCRNLLIYLSSDEQNRLLPLFHHALNPGGILLLGNAESAGGFADLFARSGERLPLYRKLESPAGTPKLKLAPAPTHAWARKKNAESAPLAADIQVLADRLVLERIGPIAALCTDKGEVRYVSSRAGKYLEPAVGQASMDLMSMAREGLQSALAAAFSAAKKSNDVVRKRKVRVKTNEHTQVIDLTVQRLPGPKDLRGMILVIIEDVADDVPSPKDKSGRLPARIVRMQRELDRAQDELRTTREEMQSSQEELRSTNEELQSTNEELQISNEQLTTAKEELQSLNEELQTVNQELSSKVDDLSHANDDLNNLLDSTELATLFLDADLRVRRFTLSVGKLIKLIPADKGRSVTDIATELDYPAFANDAREVLRKLVPCEKQVGATNGRWFTVRILPYRTVENAIAGVVVTFADATASRKLENSLRRQADQLRQMVEAMPDLVWGAGPDGGCDYVSHQWLEYTGIAEERQLGNGWLEAIHPEDRARVDEAWKRAVTGKGLLDGEFRLRKADGKHRWFKARSVAIRDETGAVTKWYVAATDIDDSRRANAERTSLGGELDSPLDGFSDGFVELDEALRVVFVNAAAAGLVGHDRTSAIGKDVFDAIPELRGSDFEEKVRAVLRERAPASLEVALRSPSGDAHYLVRLYPRRSPAGVSVIFARGQENSADEASGTQTCAAVSPDAT